MEENKDLQPEEKKTTKSGTTKKTTTKKTTTKKAGTNSTTKKTTAKKAPAKKATTSTAKKTTTKKETTTTTKRKTAGSTKKAETTLAKVVEEKLEPIKEEKIEPVEVQMPKVEEKIDVPKVSEVKKEKAEVIEKKEEPKFKPTAKVEKKKEHKVLKFILSLIIVALVLFLIHFARNYLIISDILAKQEELDKIQNYSLQINYVTQNVSLEYYHKENKSMLVKTENNGNDNKGKSIIWSNKDTKEIIFLAPKQLKAIIQKIPDDENFSFIHDLKPSGVVNNWVITRGFDFTYWITSDKINGKDCYKVTWITSGETNWFDKENGTLVKTTNERNESEYVTEITNWEFNKLTDIDMSRPNLIGYEIK